MVGLHPELWRGRCAADVGSGAPYAYPVCLSVGWASSVGLNSTVLAWRVPGWGRSGSFAAALRGRGWDGLRCCSLRSLDTRAGV